MEKIKKGDILNVTDQKNPSRDGTYKVTDVKYEGEYIRSYNLKRLTPKIKTNR